MSGPTKLTVAEARAILGVAAEAGLDEAARAFRALAKQAHPDRPGGDAERFREVLGAWRAIQAAPAVPSLFVEPPAGGSFVEISPRIALQGGEVVAFLQTGRRVRVRIPAGSRHGERVRVGRAGEAAIRIVAEATMQVRGSDVWMTAQAPAFVLGDGGRAEISTPLGPRTLWITRKAAERRLIRLEGEGLPARGPHRQGSLFIRLEPETGAPESLARAQLRKFAAAWAA